MQHYSSKYWITLSLSPLFFATLTCCGGILAYEYALSLLYSYAALLTVYSVLFFFKKNNLLLIAVVSTLSFFGGYSRYKQVLSSHITTYKQLPTKPFDACGHIIESEIKRDSRFPSTLSIALSSINRGKKRVPYNAHIVIHLMKAPPLCVGDSISIRGISHKPLRSLSFQRYLYKEGLTTSLYMPSLIYTLHKRPQYSLARWQSAYKQRLTTRLSKTLSPLCYTLFCTLFLGMKQPQNKHYKQLQKYCSYWGIMHFLSRSGLHAVLIMGIVGQILRLLPVPFLGKELISALCMLIYHSLSWPSIAFTRALTTLLLYKLFTLQRNTYKTLHILSLTTLGVLLVNPLQLFALDFQLSFGLTWTLAWFNEVRLLAKRFPLVTPSRSLD